MSAPDGSPVGAERSIGQLFASATADMSALVHDEIALAKAQLRQDVKRGATSGGAFTAAGGLLLFSLPMLNFALAYGIRTWSGWNLAVCFLLSFAANVLIALVLALIGVVFAKKAKKSKGPQKVAASVKESAGVLQKAKPHPRPERTEQPALPALPRDRAPQAIEAVARSSS
ncbi:phage holin family protein [Streptomyces sp. NPDC059861]|uniref:phage holin family protein n=1 Tax=Streptomyces sp. NPDC059861 TaxID=3346974 RepID=UPI003666B243